MPRRILRPEEISKEPEITFDDEGNTVLISDTKAPAAAGSGQMGKSRQDKIDELVETALEASRVANNTDETRFFREQARILRDSAEKELREKFGLQRHYDKFIPIAEIKAKERALLEKGLAEYKKKIKEQKKS